MALGMVKVLGLNKVVTNVKINGKVHPTFLYNILDDVCISRCSLNLMNTHKLLFNNTDITYLRTRFKYATSTLSNHRVDNRVSIMIQDISELFS